jgi:hypothetical protein
MILHLLIAASVHAADKPAYCVNTTPAKIEKQFPLPNDVNYFARAAGTQEMGFATSEGNRVLNTLTGNLEQVPGAIDPVLSPDGRILAVPMTTAYDPLTGKFNILEVKDIKEVKDLPKYYVYGNTVLEMKVTGTKEHKEIKMEHSLLKPEDLRLKNERYLVSAMTLYGREKDKDGKMPALYLDHEVQENYQSLGVLSSRGDDHRYRMLFQGESGVQSRDYALLSGKMQPSGSARKVCDKMTGLDTPMISRDGTEFSAYDQENDRTIIVKIGSGGGDCRIVQTIPALVGKADFSPDGSKIAFHIDGNTDEHSFFENPNEKNRMTVMVLDRISGKISGIPGLPKENDYYPVFLDNDRIAFINTRPEDGKNKFSVHIVNLKDQPTLSCTDCQEGSANAQKAALLGAAFNSRCENGDRSFRGAFAAYSQMTPTQCRALVKDLGKIDLEKWIDPAQKGWRKEILETIDQDGLAKVCDSEDSRPQPVPGGVPTAH